ncbi:MAG: hypothetical protein IH597_05135 [Bacteroidales bacterium]|nr:hypothetical protein [Bacteroidales bacterium]
MYNLISTYRIQFHKDYGLKDLEKQIKYLALLGVGTIYASINALEIFVNFGVGLFFSK